MEKKNNCNTVPMYYIAIFNVIAVKCYTVIYVQVFMVCKQMFIKALCCCQDADVLVSSSLENVSNVCLR